MALKLLTICHMYPCRLIPRHGIFLKRQAEFLRGCGIECFFVVPRPWAPWPFSRLASSPVYGNDNPLLKDECVQEVRFFRLPGRWFKRFEEKSMTNALMGPTRELHQKEKFDAIWACPVIPDAVAALSLREALSLPLASLAIGSDIMVSPQDPTLRKQVKRVLAASDLCIGVSEAICQRMRELESCDPIRVFLGRDASMFRPAQDRSAIRRAMSIPDDAIVATYVGLLSRTKGISELCKAAESLLSQERFHLICVGAGPAESLVEAIGSPRVHMVGEQSPENVPRFLQAADFFVFPSYSEGMPQAVIEAMHCGLPVVATDVGGTSEAVSNGVNGLLIPPQRADLLLEAMKTMIVDEALRKSAGQHSVAIAAERFDSQANAEFLAQAFRSMVAEATAR